MIRTFEITKYKCFEHLRVEGCKRINAIVGDNGAGKTALLEALFWALGTTSEFAVRFRQARGLEGTFSGSSNRIEEAIWRDYFYRRNWSVPISISTQGDGPETRAVVIAHGVTRESMPFGPDAQYSTGSIIVEWTDSSGNKHRSVPRISQRGMEFPSNGEDNPDWFYHAAGQMTNSTELAGRFSDLSRVRRAEEFTKTFTDEYPWISDIGIEVVAGAPVIYATIKGQDERVAIANASGGINRTVGILLSIASRTKGVVLVDEMEDGVHHKHHVAIWKGVLAFTRKFESQIFLTTHSDEWLSALVRAAGDKLDDIALWRIERNENGRLDLVQIDGNTLSAGIEYQEEVRGK